MQLYENIIVCGVPGLGSNNAQPAFSCAPNSPPRRRRRGLGQVITRRLIVNLIVFFVVSFALVGYGIVNLLGNPLAEPDHAHDRVPRRVGPLRRLRGRAQRRARRHGQLDRADRARHQGHHEHQPGHRRARRRAGVGADRQRPGRAGRQPGADARRHRARPPERRQRARRAQPDARPTSAPSSTSATRLLQAIPAHDLNKLIGELATALQGQAGNLRTLIDAGTTFSKEFVAYQQQFTELLANAPPALDAVTAVAPELRQDLANTAALVQVLAEQKQSGLHDLLANGSSAFAQINNLVTSQSANLGCVLHDTADILTNLAQPANLTNLSQGLAYNTYFFGAVDNIAVAGIAKATDEEQPARPEPGLPAHPPAAAADPVRAGRVLRRRPTRSPTRCPAPAAPPSSARASARRPRPASPPPPAARGQAERAGGRRRARTRPDRPGHQRLVPGARAAAPACCSPWAAWSSRSCSWPGAPARRAGARAAARL